MKFIKLSLFLTGVFFIFSCKTQQKVPYYLEAKKDTSRTSAVVIPEILIQKNDQLSIQIYSLSTEPRADALYNMPQAEGGSAANAGYWVDLQGNILHHRLGVIHVEGLTKNQVADVIRRRLTEPVELLRSPTVMVQLLNFKISILGQVGREGPISVQGNRMTIFEAIAMAGGVTDYGKRDSVLVIRERNGIQEKGIVNLSSDSVFHSPYYNLMQNDLIVVGQTKQRMKELDQQRVYQKLTLGLSLVLSAASLARLFF